MQAEFSPLSSNLIRSQLLDWVTSHLYRPPVILAFWFSKDRALGAPISTLKNTKNETEIYLIINFFHKKFGNCCFSYLCWDTIQQSHSLLNFTHICKNINSDNEGKQQMSAILMVKGDFGSFTSFVMVTSCGLV